MGARENYGSGSRNPRGSNERAEWYRRRDEEIQRDWREQERRRLEDVYHRSDYGAGMTSSRQEADRQYAERIRRELDQLNEDRRRDDERRRQDERHPSRRPCPECRGDGVANVQMTIPDRDGNLTYLWSRESCRVCGGRGTL